MIKTDEKHHVVTINVNGVSQTASVEARKLLVHLLRDDLGLTGTHVGCDTSQCGACTVDIDGQAVKSCTVLILHGACRDGEWIVDHDHRRPRAGRRRAASDSGRVPRAPRIAMRLLHGGDDHECAPVAQAKSEPHGERNPSQPNRQHLPLHRLYQHRARSCIAGLGGTRP